MNSAKFLPAAAMALAMFVCADEANAQAPKLIRSQAGPSGRLAEGGFIFDETRNRFVYPQDKTLTVLFEWEFVPGDHVLTATWKQPDGRVVSVSPDVKMQTTASSLSCRWTFQISPGSAPGAWTVEVRIDGQPAGSHTFELAGVDATDERFTLDRVFKTYGASIVRVHRFDASGRRVDTTNGFVIAKDAIATAFQSIDMAETLEVEFADGRAVRTNEVHGYSRLDDWAVIKADTGNVAPIPRGDSKAITVGGRLAVFAVDAGTRIIAAVDVGAVSSQRGYAARIRFAPPATPEAFGGPIIDDKGTVVGILGGSMTPGIRIDQRTYEENPWMYRQREPSPTATVIGDVPPVLPPATTTLENLKGRGDLTPPMIAMPELSSGGVTAQLPKSANDRSARDVLKFSARDDAQIIVYTYWLKRDKLSKGELSFNAFDATNRLRASAPPKKVSLNQTEQRFAFSFSPKGLTPGFYRLEVCWDGRPVWRVYVTVVE